MNIKDFAKTKSHELAIAYASNKFNKYLNNKILSDDITYTQDELSMFIKFYGLALKDVTNIINDEIPDGIEINL